MHADFTSRAVVEQARKLFDEEKFPEVWVHLAHHGDDYADNAAAVTGGGLSAYDQAFDLLVRNHWRETVGIEAYNNKFVDVAEAHLNNYLRVLESGRIPTSTEIVRSYKDALEHKDLPPVTAFDAAVEAAGYGNVWAILLGMDKKRIVPPDVNNDIDPRQAKALILSDLIAVFNALNDQGLLIDVGMDSAWRLFEEFAELVPEFGRILKNIRTAQGKISSISDFQF